MPPTARPGGGTAKGGKAEILVKRYANIADYDFASRLRINSAASDWNTPTDRSGNYNSLTVAGGTAPNFYDSVMGRGMVFTTAGTPVTAGLEKNLADADAFMILWHGYFTASGSTQALVSRGKDGSGTGWSIILQRGADTHIELNIIKTSGGAAGVSAIGTNLVPDFIPTTIVGVWEPGVALRLYTMGALDAETLTSATGLRASTVLMRLGISNVDAAGTLDAVCSRLLIGNKVPDASVIKTISLFLQGDVVNDFQVNPNDTILGPFDGGNANHGRGWILPLMLGGQP